MATSYSPSIVTNGLKLALDSGNPATYPGTGNTWTDLLHPFQTFSGVILVTHLGLTIQIILLFVYFLRKQLILQDMLTIQ